MRPEALMRKRYYDIPKPMRVLIADTFMSWQACCASTPRICSAANAGKRSVRFPTRRETIPCHRHQKIRDLNQLSG
jgi:hypothetical protein